MSMFWTFLFFAGLIWYIVTVIVVGYKGFQDVQEMLLNISKNNKKQQNINKNSEN